MGSTKRPQNKCKKCGYTWYPRGKSISLKCPNCGSSEVGFAGSGLGLVAAVVIGFLVLGGKNEPTTTAQHPAASTPVALDEQNYSGPQPTDQAMQNNDVTKVAEPSVIQPTENASQPTSSTLDPQGCSEGMDKSCEPTQCETGHTSRECGESNKPTNELY